MKKLLPLFLCLAIALSFAACGNKPNPELDFATQKIEQAEKAIKSDAKIAEGDDIFSGKILDQALITKFTGYDWLTVGLKGAKLERNYSAYKTAVDTYIATNLDTDEKVAAVSSGTFNLLALAYKACGGNPEKAGAAEFDLVKSGTYGNSGIVSADVWAIINALTVAGGGSYAIPSATVDSYIDALLAKQNKANAWSWDDSVDVDTTAKAIQALAPFYGREKVKTAVDKAIAALEGVQLENGAFPAYGGASSASTAEVVVALCAMKINPKTDARFISASGKTLFDALELFNREGAYTAAIDGTDFDLYSTISAVKAYGAYYKFTDSAKGLYDFK